MKIVGMAGGGSLCELGPPSDVQLFFDCVKEFAVAGFPDQDWNVLTDRLYRRYLRIDELATAEVLMATVKEVFANLSASTINWDGIEANSEKTRLDPNKSTLEEIFARYFENFSYCQESAKVFFDTWEIYQPLRIVIADMPEFVEDKRRPLEQYDALDGKAFWLR